MADLQSNKDIVRRWLRSVILSGDGDAERLVREDCTDHSPGPGQAAGRAGHLSKMAYVRSVFSERALTIEHLVAEGDLVVDHWTFRGVHSGADFMGAPADGRTVEFAGIDIVRIRDGQIVDIWHVEDFLSALRQLGA